MNGQEYLNQISAENRPPKQSGGSGFSNSLIFKVIIGTVIALIVIIIIGSILGGIKNKEKNESILLKLHLDTTAQVIQQYRNNIKSSLLRSNGASLYSVLTNTSNDISSFLTDTYQFKWKDKDVEKEVGKDAVAEIKTAGEELEANFFEAKINGNLDRTFTHKMIYEVSLLMSEESKMINLTKNEEYKNALEKSYESLTVLYGAFNEFSEAK